MNSPPSRFLLLLPFLLSVLHIALHPYISVSTGEGKLRGHFIDENTLSSTLSSLSGKAARREKPPLNSLTEMTLLDGVPTTSSICKDLSDNLQYAYPTCTATPMTLNLSLHPSLSAGPSASTHIHILSSPTANSLTLISSLATAIQTTGAWLPHTLHITLSPDPPRLLNGIRSAIVLRPSNSSTFRLLPSGSNGLVPNLDLVSLLATAAGVWIPANRLTFTTLSIPSDPLPHHYFAFLYDTLHPAPHDVLLIAGIDAVTLEVPSSLYGTADFLQYLLVVLRCLTSLEERLHHSVRSYILLPNGFLSNGEFLYTLVIAGIGLAVYGVRAVHHLTLSASDIPDSELWINTNQPPSPFHLLSFLAACFLALPLATLPRPVGYPLTILAAGLLTYRQGAPTLLPYASLLAGIGGIVLGMQCFTVGILVLLPVYMYVIVAAFTNNLVLRGVSGAVVGVAGVAAGVGGGGIAGVFAGCVGAEVIRGKSKTD